MCRFSSFKLKIWSCVTDFSLYNQAMAKPGPKGGYLVDDGKDTRLYLSESGHVRRLEALALERGLISRGKPSVSAAARLVFDSFLGGMIVKNEVMQEYPSIEKCIDFVRGADLRLLHGLMDQDYAAVGKLEAKLGPGAGDSALAWAQLLAELVRRGWDLSASGDPLGIACAAKAEAGRTRDLAQLLEMKELRSFALRARRLLELLRRDRRSEESIDMIELGGVVLTVQEPSALGDRLRHKILADYHSAMAAG